MKESKTRKLEDIDYQITACKSRINDSQVHVLSSFAKLSTPKRGTNAVGYQADFRSKQAETVSEADVVSYLKTMGKLKENLQQKSYILQVQREKDRNKLESIITQMQDKMKTQAQEINAKAKSLENMGKLQLSVNDLSQKNTQKSAQIQRLRSQVVLLKQENLQLKMQNKTIKADNKIVVAHLDRLMAPSQGEKPRDDLAQRQLRVIRSLYEHKLPRVEAVERDRQFQSMGELKNKVLLIGACQANGDLKSLLRRQNQEIAILRKEKDMLAKQNEQQHVNLENQKQLVKMWELSNQKLNAIINKMGDKLIALESLNETLSQGQEEVQNPSHQNYYEQTKIKVGQLYRKKV